MQLLTADGGYQAIAERSSPMTGLDFPKQYSNAFNSVDLVSSANGEQRWLTYDGIYRSNPWVWAVVNAKANGISRLPIHAFELHPDGGRHRVRGDLPGAVGRPSAGAQLDTLMRRPNPGTSRRRLVRRMMKGRLVYGNALWSIERDKGSIAGLWNVPWRRVTVRSDSANDPLYYELRSVGGSGPADKHLLPEDVVHFRYDDDDESPLGISPIGALRHTIRLYEAMVRHITNFFANQARLSGHVKVERGGNNPQLLQEIRRQITEMYTSPENAGKVLVTSGEWQQTSADPSHSSIIELIHLSREEVCAAYQVPPPVAGILDKAIKSNVKELRELYVRDTIGPEAEATEAEIMAQLVRPNPAWAYNFVEFELGEQLRPDIVQRAEAYKTLRYVYSTDELRGFDNLPPIGTPDAVVPMVPVNERPIGIKASEYGAVNTPVADEEPPAPTPEPDDDPDDDLGEGDEE